MPCQPTFASFGSQNRETSQRVAGCRRTAAHRAHRRIWDTPYAPIGVRSIPRWGHRVLCRPAYRLSLKELTLSVVDRRKVHGAGVRRSPAYPIPLASERPIDHRSAGRRPAVVARHGTTGSCQHSSPAHPDRSTKCRSTLDRTSEERASFVSEGSTRGPVTPPVAGTARKGSDGYQAAGLEPAASGPYSPGERRYGAAETVKPATPKCACRSGRRPAMRWR